MADIVHDQTTYRASQLSRSIAAQAECHPLETSANRQGKHNHMTIMRGLDEMVCDPAILATLAELG
jgi:hypothetical protein